MGQLQTRRWIRGRENDEKGAAAHDKVLSELHFAVEAAFLPVYSDLFGVCYDRS